MTVVAVTGKEKEVRTTADVVMTIVQLAQLSPLPVLLLDHGRELPSEC